MKILFVGDVVGKPGRAAVRELVPEIRRQHGIDFCVINAENAAGGGGLTPDVLDELKRCPVDAITMGDHVWDKSDIMEVIDHDPCLVRPLNYPPGTAGHGITIVKAQSGNLKAELQAKGGTFELPALAVVNLMGRVFMRPNVDCPFRAMEAELERVQKITKLILVDMHAEATSEKLAMGRFLDGRVTGVVGTHTHVATADEQIFPGGTAYITDVGMCGPHESILGRDIESVLKRFLTQVPQRFGVATDNIILNGVIIEADAATGKATAIERISVPCKPSE
jgi:2',3'-cyclic-nucleotide 2'-phosphodiesterase